MDDNFNNNNKKKKISIFNERISINNTAANSEMELMHLTHNQQQQQQQQIPTAQLRTSPFPTSRLRVNQPSTNDVPFVIGANAAYKDFNLFEKILIFLSYLLIVLFFPISLFFSLKTTQEYERAVIFRLGRLLEDGTKGPGLFLLLPCIESYNKVDMRTVSFDVPPQEILTKDSVTVAVDAVVYYRVFNPVISISNVENAAESTRLIAQTSLRNVLGTIDLSEILSNREDVSQHLREILKEATYQWGIRAERVEIKDVRLPVQLQRAMAAEAEATREARAKVIAAEGEERASHSLRQAAIILSESSLAYQLRYLQTLSNIAMENNSTILFPIPIEFFTAYSQNNNISNNDNNKLNNQ